MKVGIVCKSMLANALEYSGQMDNIFRSKGKSRYVILMYHRIIPPREAPAGLQPGMYVEPKTFEMHIQYLKEYFQVVSLMEKFSHNQVMGKTQSPRPVCILTFDDGWRDFYEFAYPVLKRNHVPATVFLPTRYVGTNDVFWTDQLAFLLKNTIPITRNGKPSNTLLEMIVGTKGTHEKKLETAINMLKNLEDGEIEEILAKLKERVSNVSIPKKRVFLNWEEVREMRGSGLISFGSHTHNHRILVHIEEEEVREEITLSRKILIRQGAVDHSFIPFCYPNGNSNQRIISMVREAGYHAAVSTVRGWNHAGDSPFELKRVAVHQDMTASRGMFGCRVAGIL